jgi:hypothetical protein
MNGLTRFAVVVGVLAVGALGALVMAAAFWVEWRPILKNLTLGTGVFLWGCASAIWAGAMEQGR